MLAIVIEHYPSGCVFGHDEEVTAQEAVGVGEVKRWLTMLPMPLVVTTVRDSSIFTQFLFAAYEGRTNRPTFVQFHSLALYRIKNVVTFQKLAMFQLVLWI